MMMVLIAASKILPSAYYMASFLPRSLSVIPSSVPIADSPARLVSVSLPFYRRQTKTQVG